MKRAVIISLLFWACFAAEVSFAGNYPFWGKITRDNINLRADAGINSKSLRKLPKGFVVKVIGSAYEWYKVSLPADVHAYIYKKYADVDGRAVTVVGNAVNVRACAGLNCPILGKANEGEKFKFCGNSESWVCVYGGKGLYAWVHQKFVKAVKRPAVRKEASLPPPPPKKNAVEKQAKQVDLSQPKAISVNVEEKGQTASGQSDKTSAKDMPIAIGVLAKVKVGAQYAYAIVDEMGRIIYWLDGRDITLKIFKGSRVKVFGKIKDRTYRDLPVIKVKKLERMR